MPSLACLVTIPLYTAFDVPGAQAARNAIRFGGETAVLHVDRLVVIGTGARPVEQWELWRGGELHRTFVQRAKLEERLAQLGLEVADG